MTRPGSTKMIADSLPAAAATVCTTLFSWMVASRIAFRIAIEITAAGIEVENVRPAFNPKYTFAAVNTIVIAMPMITPRTVSSRRGAPDKAGWFTGRSPPMKTAAHDNADCRSRDIPGPPDAGPGISLDRQSALSCAAVFIGGDRPVNQPALSGAPRRELTVRGVIIGIAITIVFTAANVYFGLKAGLTFSTSIPAAVISMAILKAMRDATIQENNVVQTVAAAAGKLSAIIFVLPGLVIVGYWTGFPFWTSAAICATGGILGVMYTIPLRRALVTDSDLPYPEGVACAEVLKVGSGQAHGDGAQSVDASSAGLKAVVWGSIVSAVFYIVVQTKIFASDVAQYFRLGSDEKSSATGYDFNLSFALFAVGHLVGLWVGVAMLVGALIGWGWAVPHFTALHPAAGAAADVAQGAWSHYVRFVGAGAIGIAAIWTLAKLMKPLVGGLAGAFRASRARKSGTLDQLPRTEHDMPIGLVGLISLLCLLPIGYLLWHFAVNNGLGGAAWTLVIGGVAFVVLLSFVVSAVTGYMAGLIGSSNSPLSGIPALCNRMDCSLPGSSVQGI